jgi:hypothetical protein
MIAVKSTGSVWAWGWGFFGQLGSNISDSVNMPRQIVSLSGVKSLAGGYAHSLAVQPNGSIVAWGANYSSQLGNGRDENSVNPIEVLGFVRPLSDVSGHWAESSIQRAVALRWIDGYPDGSFHPDAQVSRAEFAKMIASLLQLNVQSTADDRNWYDSYLRTLKVEGIVHDGDLGGALDQPITRLEMVRLSLRASDKELRVQAANVTDSYFLLQATKSGLMQGLENGNLAPDASSTRAQAVVTLERLNKLMQGGILDIDPAAVVGALHYMD